MASTAAAAAASAPPPSQPVDLSEKLEKTACYARNEDSRFPWSNLLIGDTRLGCKSDADEQLILHFEFSEFVKVHSLKLTEFNNGVDPEQNPTVVKLFVNRNNLGFEDIDDVDPTMELELTAEDLKENADNTLVQYVKFQRVKSITLFVEENNGGEITSLGALRFYGKPVATTNMNDFKKNPNGE